MPRFIDDLAGAVSDCIKFLITSFGYFFAGVLMVGIPLYLFVLLIRFVANY